MDNSTVITYRYNYKKLCCIASTIDWSIHSSKKNRNNAINSLITEI